MKIFAVILLLLFNCCQSKRSPSHASALPLSDTIKYQSSISQSPDHSSLITTSLIIDTCKTDSLKQAIDSLRTKLFIAEYKLQRVKYYLNITLKDASQTKFLKGWIKRAIQ